MQNEKPSVAVGPEISVEITDGDAKHVVISLEVEARIAALAAFVGEVGE
jgi:hypothetical protein